MNNSENTINNSNINFTFSDIKNIYNNFLGHINVAYSYMDEIFYFNHYVDIENFVQPYENAISNLRQLEDYYIKTNNFLKDNTGKKNLKCTDLLIINKAKYYLTNAYKIMGYNNPEEMIENLTHKNIKNTENNQSEYNKYGKLIINGKYIDMTDEASSANVSVLPRLVGNDLNMSFQDGSKYECKLVDGQGNPIKGAELTYNINDVFYHKITDENGIARLNINLFPGVYIITASYDELTMTSNTIIVSD